MICAKAARPVGRARRVKLAATPKALPVRQPGSRARARRSTRSRKAPTRHVSVTPSVPLRCNFEVRDLAERHRRGTSMTRRSRIDAYASRRSVAKQLRKSLRNFLENARGAEARRLRNFRASRDRLRALPRREASATRWHVACNVVATSGRCGNGSAKTFSTYVPQNPVAS
jgi:hypothetical protein